MFHIVTSQKEFDNVLLNSFNSYFIAFTIFGNWLNSIPLIQEIFDFIDVHHLYKTDFILVYNQYNTDSIKNWEWSLWSEDFEWCFFEKSKSVYEFYNADYKWKMRELFNIILGVGVKNADNLFLFKLYFERIAYLLNINIFSSIIDSKK